MLNSENLNRIIYYAVYNSKYDGNLLYQDLLSELRREFFSTGQRLKNKVVREIDGTSYRYSYLLEKGAPLKWKKMSGYRLLERSEPDGEGGYRVVSQNSSKALVKITYYDADHLWTKTEYFVPGKKFPAALLVPNAENGALRMKEFDEERSEFCYDLYPCEIPRNITELNLLNSSAGVPEFVAQTAAGDFYYCKQEDIARRNTVLEAIRSSNQQDKPLFVPQRPQTEEDVPADRAEGFHVDPLAFGETGGAKEEPDKTAVGQPETSRPKEYGADSYQWGVGSEHLDKYVLGDEDTGEKPQEESAQPQQDVPAQNEMQTASESEANTEDAKETMEAAETVKNAETAEIAETAKALAPESPVQTAFAEDAAQIAEPAADTQPADNGFDIDEDVQQDAQKTGDWENVRLSPEERQKVRRYNVIVKPISRNIYAGADCAPNGAADETAEEGKEAAPPEDGGSLPVSPAGTKQEAADDSACCNGVVNGCPYQSQGKMMIPVSTQESYYYFGNVENGLREGRGRTVMQSGCTAYEGSYLNDMREGFGTYYYKTGKLCYAGGWKENKRHGVGVSFRPNDGTVHVGCWNEDVPVGMGSRFDRDGNLLFAGRWENGMRQGAGVTYHAQDGRIFVGQWVDDVLCGKGTEFDPQGNLLYTGGWRDCMRNGFGTEYSEQGGVIYSGDWKNNCYEGQGTLHLTNNHTVRGEFRQGRVNGHAAEYDEHGFKIYEGCWQNGLRHGEGCRYFNNGGRYQGNFVNGVPSGFLAGYNAQGNLVYMGEWQDDEFSGEGSYYVNDEKVYEGGFLHNRYHGHGVEYQNGSYVYSGNFIGNMRCGFGTSYQDGKMEYVGQWKESLFSGPGILYEQGQPRYAGEFSQGGRHGRINVIENGRVCAECVYDGDALCYIKKYNEEGTLICEGNMRDGKLNGMGCTFTASGEKMEEGIFAQGKLIKSMRVRLKSLPPLPQVEMLLNTEYERCRRGPDYVVEKAVDGGLYTGLLKDDRPQGLGTMLRTDHRFTGMFKDGAPCGKGVVYKNDGTTLKGSFSVSETAGTQYISFADGAGYYFRQAADGEEQE